MLRTKVTNIRYKTSSILGHDKNRPYKQKRFFYFPLQCTVCLLLCVKCESVRKSTEGELEDSNIDFLNVLVFFYISVSNVHL